MRRFAALLVAFFLAAQVAGSQEAGFSWSLYNIKVNWFVVPTGPILKFGYGPWQLLPGLRTDLESELGFGYENFRVYRDDVTGNPQPIGATEMPRTNKPDLQWELGFRQGLIPLEEARDLLSVWGSLNLRAEVNLGTSVASIFPDRNSAGMGSLAGGLLLDNTTKTDHKVRDGVQVIAEGEWGPSFLSLQATDFWRLKAEVTEFVPLFDLEGESNLLSAYLVLRANTKYIQGSQVPIFMLEETDVRAYPLRLDTRLRAYATAELRINLPSLLGKADLLPTMFVYSDNGYYSGYNDMSSTSVWKSGTQDSSGPLASVGGGLSLDVLGLASVVVSAGLPLLDNDSLGLPISNNKAFWWTIELGLHLSV